MIQAWYLLLVALVVALVAAVAKTELFKNPDPPDFSDRS